MGCCISRLKMDQNHDPEESKSPVPKRSTLFNKNVIYYIYKRNTKNQNLN